jgi:RHS repeat-associated protein
MKRPIDSLRGLLARAGHAARVLSLAGAALAIALPASAGETVTHFHNDISGTPVMATDAAGNVVWKENYRPYGGKLNNQPASTGNKIGFAGQPFDANTGLSYMGARYYDPVLGRFMGVDPAPPSLGNVHSLNRYAYGNNNPYRYVDPDGHAGALAWAAPIMLLAGGGWWWSTQSAEQRERMVRDADRAVRWVKGLIFNEGAQDGGAADAGGGTAGPNTATGNPDPNGDNDGDTPKKGKSVNQINNDVKRDKAPVGIKRADTGKVTGEQDHIHFDNGNALNRDGTWKHVNSSQGPTRAQEKYLVDAGWTLPK